MKKSIFKYKSKYSRKKIQVKICEKKIHVKNCKKYEKKHVRNFEKISKKIRVKYYEKFLFEFSRQKL